MHILLLGGGVFLGAAILKHALERGHELTVFNRGRARSEWPDGVQAIVGDRVSDLGALAGERFDAVIDLCGYAPADVQKSAEALHDVKTYCFVSSISAYTSFGHPPIREIDPLADFSKIDPADRDIAHYGRRRRPARPRCRRCSASAR